MGQFWEASLEFKADYEDISRPLPLIDTKHQKVKQFCESMNYYHSDNPYYILDKKCDSLPEYSFPVSVDIQASILQELGGEIQDYAYLITYQDECNEYLSLKEKSEKL